MPLGERIRHARDLRRWTQQQLADMLEVSRESISNWENGHTHPRARDLRLLEQVLGPLTGQAEDLLTLADAIRNSRPLNAGQRQALLAQLDQLNGQPQGKHSLTPHPARW